MNEETTPKSPKVFAQSYERYKANANERRMFPGSKTVTKFLVGFEGSEPNTWKRIVGYGPTPGERKTYAINNFLAGKGALPEKYLGVAAK